MVRTGTQRRMPGWEKEAGLSASTLLFLNPAYKHHDLANLRFV